MELSDFRSELDRIDRELTALFLRRMEISKAIGDFKRARGSLFWTLDGKRRSSTSWGRLCRKRCGKRSPRSMHASLN